jgi:recombination protein RecT
VYAGDIFEITKGTAPALVHKPNIAGARDAKSITAFYAVATYNSGRCQYEVMTLAEINAIRARSRASASGPWVTDFVAMGRKTVLRRLCKFLPMNAEKASLLERALSHDNDTAGIEAPAHETPAERAAAFQERLKGADTIDAEAAPVAEPPSADAPLGRDAEGREYLL